MTIPPFEATFATPLHCDSCVQDVKKSLSQLAGIESFEASLENQQFSLLSSLPPSKVITTLASAGRTAILRGSGESDSSAAVAILEDHSQPVGEAVKGLVRLVEVREGLVVVDVGVKGLPVVKDDEAERVLSVSVRAAGDISRGAGSVGGVWREDGKERGVLGTVNVSASGEGTAFFEVEGLRVWEIIGRGLLVCPQGREEDEELLSSNGQGRGDVLVGVVARSAGAWGNDKVVCSCSGKTVWEEREEMVGKGML
ncbi:superoxide dismutase copper chaperone Lys7 like protein [Zymoseptoria brevis]|uniref:Superoxide dismutase 1 copper chaperone n=1 Tax=Zymoseptoria brevis TaxID=1047168 RepID=A0A0F4GNC3_9PEZI|nr:superoxide dismutase copper chaperone Lys7 like protein [Zymoseptoria brevis]